MKSKAREIDLTSDQKAQYALMFGFTSKEQREIAAWIFHEEVLRFIEKHSITVGDIYVYFGSPYQIPFTRENVDKICAALSELAGVEFENNFNNKNS